MKEKKLINETLIKILLFERHHQENQKIKQDTDWEKILGIHISDKGHNQNIKRILKIKP